MKNTSRTLAAIAIIVALGFVVRRTQQSMAGARHVDAAKPVEKISTEGMKPAPELVLKDLNDKETSLHDFAGKVVLVNFWATWCDPCRTEIPWLIDLEKRYGDKGFVVLGVSMDDEGKKAVQPFVEKERFDVNGEKLPMNYPILIGDSDVADKFLGGIGGIVGLPTSVLISRDEKRVKTTIGPVDPEKLERDIRGLLP
jgi:thiol-disulfide isomerase/thioredoxin